MEDVHRAIKTAGGRNGAHSFPHPACFSFHVETACIGLNDNFVMLSTKIQAMEVDLVTGAHLSGNRVVHRELVIVLQGPCGASVSGGACGACFSHVCGESTTGGAHRIMVGGGAHFTSFAVLAARTSVGVHPASFCRDRSTCAMVKNIVCAPMPVVVVEAVPSVQSAQRQW